MELVVGLILILLSLAAVGFAAWYAYRAIFRIGRRSTPVAAPTGPRTDTTDLLARLQGLRAQGFLVEDNGGGKFTLRLPLVEAGSAGGKASEEYRITLKLDEAARAAKLSESRISKESGFGGGGFFRASAWKSSTSEGWKMEEAGIAAAPGGSGGSFHLDTESAKALVAKIIADAGWNVVR